jgi:hypothetical protein
MCHISQWSSEKYYLFTVRTHGNVDGGNRRNSGASRTRWGETCGVSLLMRGQLDNGERKEGGTLRDPM